MQQHAGTKRGKVALDGQRIPMGIRVVDFLFHLSARLD